MSKVMSSLNKKDYSPKDFSSDDDDEIYTGQNVATLQTDAEKHSYVLLTGN